MRKQGAITAEVVKNALLSAAEDTYDEMGNLIEGTNSKFESMPKTWAQIWIGMQNTALAAFNPILTKLNQVANSAQFNTVINGAISGLTALATVATGVLDILINGAAFVVDNWSWISPIVYGLVGAFIAYNAVALITNGINTAAAAIDAVRAARLAMTTVANGSSDNRHFCPDCGSVRAQCGPGGLPPSHGLWCWSSPLWRPSTPPVRLSPSLPA